MSLTDEGPLTVAVLVVDLTSRVDFHTVLFVPLVVRFPRLPPTEKPPSFYSSASTD